MEEIDNLEIRISADSQSAAQKVNALASSLDALGNSAEKARHGVFNSAEAIGELEQVATAASQVSAKLGALQSTLSSLSQLRAPDMNGFQNLTRSLTAISQGIGAFANNKNIEKAVLNIQKLASASISIASINTDVSKLSAFFEKINNLAIDSNVISGLKQLNTATRNITQAQPNENAADSLRLFIDTVRVITEDDIEKLKALSETAKNISGMKLSSLQQTEETDNSDSQTENKIHLWRGLGNAIGFTVEKAGQFLNVMGQINGSIASGMVKAVLSPIKKISSGFSKAVTKAKEFLSSIKRIAMYRLIRSAMKAISQGFQEGRENLYQYSLLINGDFAKSMDMAATSFLYLKNSIGAATAPLTNYLVPILDRVVDRVVELINKFNEMTAVLTGASTWTKAIKYPTQWQEAADDANKAAKKLKSTMLGFDELNVIEPNSTGKGSGDESGLDYSKMFMEVKVDMDAAENMKSSMPAILEPIMSAWETTGADTLNKIANSWQNIKELVGGVRDTFLEIWENGTGQRSVEIMLEITGNIARTFGNIASSIKIAWDNAGAGKRILQGVWNVANNIGTVFSRVWNDIANWAATLDFSPAMDALGGLFEAIERLTDPDGALARSFSNVWKKVLLPLGTWTIEEGVPAVIDGITGAIGLLGTAIEKSEPFINKFTDFLAKLGSITGDTVVALLECVAAMDQITRGEEVSDKTASALKKGNNAILRFATLPSELGWATPATATVVYEINKAIQNVGANWLDTTPTKDLVDYEAGQALHREEMQKQWNAPTEIVTGWDRFKMLFDAGYGNTDKNGNAKYTGINNVDYAKWTDSEREDQAGRGLLSDFKSAWAMGFNGLFGTDIDPYETNREAIQNGKHPVISALGDLLYPDKESSTKSGASTTVASTAMIGVVNWDAALDPKEAQSTLQKIKGFFTDFKTNWNTGWDSIKQTASSKWENFKTDWSTGWDSIKKTAGDKWENFKTDWGNGVETIKQKWEGFKSNWGTGWESIKKSANEKWSTFQSDWGSGVETIKQKWEDFKKAWSDGWNQIYLYAQKMVGKVVSVALWIWQGTDGSGGIKKVVNSILGGVESFFNFFVNGINFLIGQLNKLGGFETPRWIKAIGEAKGWYIPDTIGLNIQTISAFSLPRLANGGIIDSGQMFIARESGAEFVGQYNNRTAVMNNDQIVEAVATGVYKAVTDAIHNNSKNGSNEVKVYLDGRQIVTRTEEIKREKGASLISGVVFA